MAVEGDILILTDRQRLFGETVLNVYMYRCEDVPTAGALEGLATEFRADVMDTHLLYQTPDLEHYGVHVVNMFDAADVFEGALSEFGLAALAGTATLPSWVTATFRLHRGNARTRHGHKALSGLRESDTTGNAFTAPTIASLEANVSVKLAATLTAGVTDVFKPVIVKRIKEPVADTEPQQFTYRLPATQAEMSTNWSYVIQASLSGLSSMNSRKPGRGV